MPLADKVSRKIASRLLKWVDKRQLARVDTRVFSYPDCLMTARTASRYHRPRRLCDIGAYDGRWSFVAKQLNPRLEEVVIFEPQGKLLPELEALDLGSTCKHIYQCALGDQEGRFELTGGTASASLYEIARDQELYFPGSTAPETEEVDVRVLDNVYADAELRYPDLIKMDVQGFELNVLRGAHEILRHARCLVIELSLREFYKGQPPLWELLKFLEEQHYLMVDRGYELRSGDAPKELLQFDAIFLNRRQCN